MKCFLVVIIGFGVVNACADCKRNPAGGGGGGGGFCSCDKAHYQDSQQSHDCISQIKQLAWDESMVSPS